MSHLLKHVKWVWVGVIMLLCFGSPNTGVASEIVFLCNPTVMAGPSSSSGTMPSLTENCALTNFGIVFPNAGIAIGGKKSDGTIGPLSTDANDVLKVNQGALSSSIDSVSIPYLEAGASVNYHTSAGTTEDETEIKATTGRLLTIWITNTNGAARYFRCYNLTAANTTPGTSTVFIGSAIPGNTAGAGFVVPLPEGGIEFSTALTCTLTTGAADSDVAEVAANEIKWNIVYR